MGAVEADDAYDNLEHDLANIIDGGGSTTEEDHEADEEVLDTKKSDDHDDRCHVCMALDEAAITCNACEQHVCSDCLYDHSTMCGAEPAAPSHHYFHNRLNHAPTSVSSSSDTTTKLPYKFSE